MKWPQTSTVYCVRPTFAQAIPIGSNGASATGKTPDGEDIENDYKFTDEFPMADGFEEMPSSLL